MDKPGDRKTREKLQWSKQEIMRVQTKWTSVEAAEMANERMH